MDGGPGVDTSILQALLENLDIAVWAVDTKGIVTFQDGKGLREGTAPSTLGLNVFELYPEEVNTGLRQALRGTPARMIAELVPGQFWESWYVPKRDAVGAISGVIGMTVDVTEAQRAQREVAAKLEVIERQQEVIRNLETPILDVWEGVVALPLVGVIDSSRAARVTEDLLDAVSRTRARFALLDLTGIDIVDTATANHLINMTRAIGLLGATGVITGIRPNVAQTIISIGMDLSSLKTLGSLRQGLAYCIRQMAAKKDDAMSF